LKVSHWLSEIIFQGIHALISGLEDGQQKHDHNGYSTTITIYTRPFSEVTDIEVDTFQNLLVVTGTSSTAQGGGGSFKNRKRIGEIDCCE